MSKETFINFIDEDVNGCGTDVSTIAKISGPEVTNGTIKRVKASIESYISENSDCWDADGCLDAAKKQLEGEGYNVIFIFPSAEICF